VDHLSRVRVRYAGLSLGMVERVVIGVGEHAVDTPEGGKYNLPREVARAVH
jgi:hypothetical protein